MSIFNSASNIKSTKTFHKKTLPQKQFSFCPIDAEPFYFSYKWFPDFITAKNYSSSAVCRHTLGLHGNSINRILKSGKASLENFMWSKPPLKNVI